MRGMSQLRRARQLLTTASRHANVNPSQAIRKTIEAVELILKELEARERKEADARVAPNARRVVRIVGG